MDHIVRFWYCGDASRQSWRRSDEGDSTEMDDMQMIRPDFRVEIEVIAAADSAVV